MKVGTAVFEAVGRFGPLIKEAQKAQGALRGVEDSAEGLGSRVWNKAKGGLATGAKIAGGAAAGLFSAAMFKGMQRLVAIDDARGKLRGLGHDAEAVEAIMKDALASVKGTAFGMGEAATTAAGAVAAGVKPGKELQRYLSLVGDAAAIAGISLEEMGGTMNRVQTAGTAMSEDLNMLADKGLPIFQWLADAYGVSTAELKKMVSEGKIDAETYLKVIEDNIGGAAQQMGNTFSGALKNTWAAVGRVGANLLSGVFPYFQKFLNKVMDWLAPLEDVAKRVGEALGVWLERGLKAGQGLWDLLVKGDFTGALREAFGWEEDAPIVDMLFRIRDGILGLRDLLVKGDFTGALRNAFGWEEDSPAVDMLLRLRQAAIDAFTWLKTDGVGALRDAASWLGQNIGLIARLVGAVVGVRVAIKMWQQYRRTMAALRAIKMAYAAATYGAVGATYAQTAAQKAAYVAGRVQLGITKALTIAQRALNLVLANNPLGWILKALIALGAVLVLAYQNSEEFRAVVDRLWNAIKAGAAKALGWLINEGIPLLLQGFQWLGDKAAWLWENALQPAFKAIGDAAAWLAENVIGPAFGFIGDVMAKVITWVMDTGWPMFRDAMQWVGEKATWLWENAIKPALGFIWDLAKKVFGWVMETGWPWMRDAFGWIGEKASWLWANVISPVFGFIWNLAKKVFGWVKDTGWPWMRDAFGWIGEKAKWLWDKIISPYFGFIWDIAKKVFGWVKDTGWPWMRSAFQQIGDKATWLKDKIFDPVFGTIQTIVKGAWDYVKKVFGWFKSGIESVGTVFTKTRDAIGRAWAAMVNAVAKPINVVIKWVNDNFLAKLEEMINKIPGVSGVKLPRMPTIALPNYQYRAPGGAGQSGGGGGGRQFLASGGRVKGRKYGPRSDRVPAMLTVDEEVIRQRSAERMRRKYPGWLEHINAFGEPPNAKGAKGGNPIEWLGDIAGNVGAFLSDLAAKPFEAVKNMVLSLLEGIGNTWPAQAFVGLAKESIGAIANWLKEKVFGGSGNDGSGRIVGGGMGTAKMAALIRSVFPDASISSGYRPGARTASGYVSYHSLDRAIDIVGPRMRDYYRWIVNTFRNSPEIYFGPRDAYRRGKPVTLTGVTAATHPYNHVHWALRKGGWVPGRGTGDKTLGLAEPGEFMVNRKAAAKFGPLLQAMNDGLMKPGGRLDLFGMLSEAQVQAISAVRSMTGVSAGVPTVGTFVQVEGDLVGNKTEVKVEVHNPVREPSYDSVQKRLTRLGQLGIIGGRQ